ncbi:phosphate signaling complex protein PhoU [Rothia aerolata]|uniref:Phosphate-specific transport system accessory protein PhoU n=1 Tax=Rothia aerolata TaxID=1812262 RepID=A0A917IV51_9MICC|nr:phosphate signaling complex protein PhoU [Rothia aerolata]GGH65445.1 phosphate transport system regulatory protein PhoU [Rothia aerolata]
MRKVFQAELHQVGEELIQISTLVKEALVRAADSFLNSDIEEAEEVISNDQRIDFLQNQLDERCIDILALQGPVASDLRAIVSSLRMSSSLERMGDLARHVAQIARMRFPEKAVPEEVATIFSEMVELDTQIIDSVIKLLETRELSLTEEIYSHKARINNLHREVFKMMNAEDWQHSPQVTVDVTLASRYLERFGDHGVSVARKVNYLVTGEWS